MFTATGLGVRKNPDTTVTVKASIVDDRTGKEVARREYTAANVVAIGVLIQKDLAALVNSETDATLNAFVVGQVLGSV